MPIVAPWRPVSELINPVTLTWRVFHRSAAVAIRVTVDLRTTQSTEASCKLLLESWWNVVWAPLLVQNAHCTIYGVSALFLGGPNFIYLSDSLRGFRPGTGNDRDSSVVVVTYAGEPTAKANERHYLPGTPEDFVVDGTLTDEAVSELLTTLRGIFIGCDGLRGGAGPVLIMFKRPVVADRMHVGEPAQWAPVEQLVLCEFTDRAPLAP